MRKWGFSKAKSKYNTPAVVVDCIAPVINSFDEHPMSSKPKRLASIFNIKTVY